MHKFKMNFVAVIILISILLQLNISTVFAENDGGTSSSPRIVFSDIANIKYEKAIIWLNDLGIMQGLDDGTFKPDQTMTRAEFAVIVAKMLGLDSAVGGKDKIIKFSDVPAEYWAYDYINLVSSLNLINGFNGLFAPDQPVKYEEAIKILVCAVGYQFYAENNGGYPGGYLFTASQNGISKGVSGDEGKPCTRAMTAQLVRNALETDVMELVSFGNVQKYEIRQDRTILSEKLKIEKIKGIVQANSETGIYEQNKTRDGEVIIDGKKYLVGLTNADDLLGCSITAYIKKLDNDDERILSIEQLDSQNEITVVDSENIDRNSTSTEQFAYWVNKENDEKSTKLQLKTSIYVIYNGAFVMDFSALDLMPNIGEVKLVDNNKDGYVDVVFIKDYVDYVISSISAYDYTIYDKYNKTPLTMNFNDSNNEISIYKAGSKVAFKDIKIGDVLSVAQSRNGDVITAIISSQTITGKIDVIEDDDVIIQGQKYKKSKYYSDSFSVGDSGTFYFDFKEYIVDAEFADGSGIKYGYLIDAAEGKGIEKVVSFKILDDSGKIVFLDSTKKIKFTNAINENQVGSAIGKLVDSNIVISDNRIKQADAIVRQIIKYGVNKEGKLSTLMLTYDGTNMDQEQRSEVFSKDFSGSYLMEGSDPKTADGKYIITDDTKVFGYVESNNDDSMLMVTDGDFLKQDSTFSITGYDVTDDYHVSAVLVSTKGKPSSSDKLMLVTKLSNAVDKNGYDVIKVYGYVDGKEISINAADNLKDTTKYAAEGRLISAIKTGDVIQYSVNSEKAIKSFRILYSRNPTNPAFTGYFEGRATSNADVFLSFTSDTTDGYATLYVAKTKVYSCDGKTLVINAYGPKATKLTSPAFPLANRVCSLAKAKVFLYDAIQDKLFPGNLSDLSINSDIFVRIYANQAREIIIFKN